MENRRKLQTGRREVLVRGMMNFPIQVPSEPQWRGLLDQTCQHPTFLLSRSYKRPVLRQWKRRTQPRSRSTLTISQWTSYKVKRDAKWWWDLLFHGLQRTMRSTLFRAILCLHWFDPWPFPFKGTFNIGDMVCSARLWNQLLQSLQFVDWWVFFQKWELLVVSFLCQGIPPSNCIASANAQARSSRPRAFVRFEIFDVVYFQAQA